MEATERQYLEVLKKKIVEIMLASHAGVSKNMEDWKGNEILKFQEDLQKRVNAYISEKTFYNHFKTFHDKLPRIDLLNLLSRYAGYADWLEFKNQNRDKIILISEYKGSNRTLYWMPAAALIVFMATLLIIKEGSLATYTFCFVDKDTQEPITGSPVNVFLLQSKQPNVQYVCDSGGCLKLKTGEQRVKLLVRTPFYLEDTIYLELRKENKKKVVQLKADDYALMLHYFISTKVEDWQNRRKKLEGIIADSAYICQVFRPRMTGVELYNKEEFIDLLTMPAGNLKNMKILEILYSHDKITTIRFSLDAFAP